MSYHWT